MAIFNCYVSSPEGNSLGVSLAWSIFGSPLKKSSFAAWLVIGVSRKTMQSMSKTTYPVGGDDMEPLNSHIIHNFWCLKTSLMVISIAIPSDIPIVPVYSQKLFPLYIIIPLINVIIPSTYYYYDSKKNHYCDYSHLYSNKFQLYAHYISIIYIPL